MEYIEQDDKDIFWAENKVNSLKKNWNYTK